MDRQESEASEGYIEVLVRAVAPLRGGDLPEWLDTRAICDVAIIEYRRQRNEATGPLPHSGNAEAFA